MDSNFKIENNLLTKSIILINETSFTTFLSLQLNFSKPTNTS